MSTLQIAGEAMKTLERANDLVAQLVAENTKLLQDAAKLSDDLDEQKIIAGNWKFRAATALTRLAELEKQEPIGVVERTWEPWPNEGEVNIAAEWTNENSPPQVGTKLYAAAGASPVQPSHPDEFSCPLCFDKGPQPSQDANPNAPWLSEAHMLCADQGIPPGHITDRIRALRDKLEQPAHQFTWADVGKLIGATDQARAAGLVVGTSNWGAFVCKAMGAQPSQAQIPAPPESVQGVCSTDGLYEQAVAIVKKHQRASFSLVQRHLRISYNRATRLLEDMAKDGLITSNNNGSYNLAAINAKGAAS